MVYGTPAHCHSACCCMMEMPYASSTNRATGSEQASGCMPCDWMQGARGMRWYGSGPRSRRTSPDPVLRTPFTPDLTVWSWAGRSDRRVQAAVLVNQDATCQLPAVLMHELRLCVHSAHDFEHHGPCWATSARNPEHAVGRCIGLLTVAVVIFGVLHSTMRSYSTQGRSNASRRSVGFGTSLVLTAFLLSSCLHTTSGR
jgi:hypothetical protein